MYLCILLVDCSISIDITSAHLNNYGIGLQLDRLNSLAAANWKNRINFEAFINFAIR